MYFIFSYLPIIFLLIRGPHYEKTTIKEPEMAFVKGGKFIMGDIFNADYGSKPKHSVTLDSFYIGKYEVTQKEWVAVIGNNPSFFKGDNLPVESVTRDSVQIFLQKLNKLTGKNYRLPTEAEWEYAAREEGKIRRFGNGKDIADVNEINFDGEKLYKMPYSKVGIYRKKTVPVGSFEPNNLELYDMSGNVAEWCNDWYDKYPIFEEVNPESPKNGYVKLIRGGSFYSAPKFCRTMMRRNVNPMDGSSAIGFRVVCTSFK